MVKNLPSSAEDTALVQSLVGELRSHMLRDMSKKEKNKNLIGQLI